MASPGSGTVTIGNATGATSVTYNGTLALGRTTRLEAGNASGSVTFNGLISGAGGIVKRGSGTVNLTNAANSFAGDVTLEGGTLSASPSALGAGTTVFHSRGHSLSIAGGGATSRGLLLVSPSNGEREP
ncbi:MAG: autotransporter-associated beta strand repeat-containing protein [Kiritimatiellia bacterium]